uniref:Uncharacterized protein n=1 Tax=Caenorhabditis japonica TaxID=281687 RepID=A0A8R1E594_CAEJA
MSTICSSMPSSSSSSSSFYYSDSPFDTNNNTAKSDLEIQKIRSVSRRSSRRRSSLADVVADVNRVSDSIFRKFVNSTLTLVATMREKEKRSVKQLIFDV